MADPENELVSKLNNIEKIKIEIFALLARLMFQQPLDVGRKSLELQILNEKPTGPEPDWDYIEESIPIRINDPIWDIYREYYGLPKRNIS